MGLGYALTEDFPLADCVPAVKFGTLGLMRAAGIPVIHAIYIEKRGQLPFSFGAKGIGEIASIPEVPAAAGAYCAKHNVFHAKLPVDGISLAVLGGSNNVKSASSAAGDIAGGTALRPFHSRIRVIMTGIECSLAARRCAGFSEAVRLGSCRAEGVPAEHADDTREAVVLSENNIITVIIIRRRGTREFPGIFGLYVRTSLACFG